MTGVRVVLCWSVFMVSCGRSKTHDVDSSPPPRIKAGFAVSLPKLMLDSDVAAMSDMTSCGMICAATLCLGDTLLDLTAFADDTL